MLSVQLVTVNLTISNIFLIILFILFLYLVHFVYVRTWLVPRSFLSHFRGEGVQGPPFRWLLGCMPEVIEADKKEELMEYDKRHRRLYGLIQTSIFGFLPLLNINDPAYLRYIFGSKASCYWKANDEDKEIFRPLLKNGLLLSEGAYWKSQRALISPGFHWFYLNEMVPILGECMNAWCNNVENEINKSSEQGNGDSITKEMTHDLSTITLDFVGTAAFGSSFNSDPVRASRFVKAHTRVLHAMAERSMKLIPYIPGLRTWPLQSLKDIQEGCAIMDEIVREIVQQRKNARQLGQQPVASSHDAASSATPTHSTHGDLLDLLLSAGIPDSAVEDESVNFISAGAETTSNLCSWMLYRIVSEEAQGNPVLTNILKELNQVLPDPNQIPTGLQLKELKYLECVIYESLRMHPPAPLITKRAIAAHDLNGLHIPEGTFITINANVVHRLEDYWPEPDQFRPERFMQPERDSRDKRSDEEGTDAEKEAEYAARQADSSVNEQSDLPTRQKKANHPFAFLGFSAGPRKCIGKNLAMLEVKTIFCFLLRRFNLSIVPGQKLVPHSFTKMPKYGLHIQISNKPWREQVVDDTQHADNGEIRARKAHVMKPVGMI